jgi:hypothetical protein
MWLASAINEVAVSAGMLWPDWAFTSLVNARRSEQVPATSFLARAAWAALTLSARLVPGPTPVTALPRSARSSAGPLTGRLNSQVSR